MERLVNIQIPSDRLDQAREEMTKVIERLVGYNSFLINRIHLVLEEAMVNAMKHGNKEDPEKHVLLQVNILSNHTSELLRIIVEDEGEGFDYDHVPTPDDSDWSKSDGGKGIHLMRGFMDSVRFNEKGNRVEMDVNLTSIKTLPED